MLGRGLRPRRRIVSIQQHCCRKASVALRRCRLRATRSFDVAAGLCRARGFMTSADQAANADTTVVGPQPPGILARAAGPIAVGIALLSSLATFLVLAGLTPISPTHYVVITLLLINAATGLLLVAIIAREVWKIVQARRHGRAGSRLHVRIVGLFSIIAAAPAILVSVVASVTLDRGLDRFFSTRTRAVIENSLIVAQAYVREHAQLVRGDAIAVSYDLVRAKPLFDQDRERFRQLLS